jgi:hypothetical protein
MTELKADTSKLVRELTAEEIQAIVGGAVDAFLWFNPQPDPPAMPLAPRGTRALIRGL